MSREKHAQPSLEEIRRTLQEHLPKLRNRYQVRSLGLFGSYVWGEEGSRSDLDILVEFERAPTFFRFIDLEDDLSRLVDLVMKSALKPRIGEQILSEVVAV